MKYYRLLKASGPSLSSKIQWTLLEQREPIGKSDKTEKMRRVLAEDNAN